MDFAPLVVAATMVWTLLAFAKHVLNQQWKDAVTMISAFVIGVIVATVLAESNFGAGIDVGGVAAADLNTAGRVLFGFALSSVSRSIYEVKKAVDGSDNANEASLIPPSNPPQV